LFHIVEQYEQGDDKENAGYDNCLVFLVK